MSVACVLVGLLAVAAGAQNDQMEKADHELAAGHYRVASQIYRALLTPPASDIAVLLKLSKAYAGLGDLDEAMHRAREATLIDPTSAEAHLVLAGYLDQNRDEKAASLQFERVLELKSSDEIRKAAYAPLIRLLSKDRDKKHLLKVEKMCMKEYPRDPELQKLIDKIGSDPR